MCSSGFKGQNTQFKEIPKIDSIQELARFWDTHDLTDFEDDLQEVTEPIFRREALIRIRLPQNKLEDIKEIAKSKGIEYRELIQQWVTEKAEAPWSLSLWGWLVAVEMPISRHHPKLSIGSGHAR